MDPDVHDLKLGICDCISFLLLWENNKTNNHIIKNNSSMSKFIYAYRYRGIGSLNVGLTLQQGQETESPYFFTTANTERKQGVVWGNKNSKSAPSNILPPVSVYS